MTSQLRRSLLWLLCFGVLSTTVSCATGNPASTRSTISVPNKPVQTAPTNPFLVIHVFVALADNVNQGIVPVSASLGNGDNPNTNLYWGAAFGIRTFFSKNKDWELIYITQNPSSVVLERAVFRHRKSQLFLVADAYRGREISQTIKDFLEAASGKPGEKVRTSTTEFSISGSADLVAYIGHNGLMDFKLQAMPQHRDDRQRRAIVLACARSNTSPLHCNKVVLHHCSGPLI